MLSQKTTRLGSRTNLVVLPKLVSASNFVMRGFTLIELLVALSIIVLLAAFAFPSYQFLLAKNESDIVQQQLLQTLQFAQQEARIKHTTIAVCKSQNNLDCGGDWRDGVMVFDDKNGDGSVTSRDQLLLSIQFKTNGKLYWRGFPVYRNYLQFSGEGFQETDNSTFWYCRLAKRFPDWTIQLNKSGRARAVKPDSHGEIRDANGKVLAC